MATVIAKNTTASSITIEDLGIDIPLSSQLTLSDLFDFADISNSSKLKAFVTNGTIVINNGTIDLSVANGLKHIYYQTNYEDLLDDSTINTSSSLSTVQARRTTSIALSTTWQDVLLDATDLQNNSSVIEHSLTETNKILIKTPGIYLIDYSYTARSSGATRDSYSRIMIDGTTLLNGSAVTQNLYANETHQQVGTMVANLNDCYLTFQVSSASTPIIANPDFVLIVTKLSGMKGDQGIQGIQGNQGEQGLPGLPGTATVVKETSILNEAKITSIINTSGASQTNFYVLLVQTDSRTNKTLPTGISGDKTGHIILYDGTNWFDLGIYIGIQGPQGIQGIQGIAGNSVTVQNNGTDIMTNVAIINFTGNVSLTTAAGSKVNASINQPNICQLYNSSGGLSINNTTAVALPYNVQSIIDSNYTHSISVNNTRISINTTGWYKLSFSICFDAANKSSIYSYVRKNGTTKVLLTDSYSSTVDATSDNGTTCSTSMVYLTNGEYIELMSELAGSATTVVTIASQCWILLEYIRGA